MGIQAVSSTALDPTAASQAQSSGSAHKRGAHKAGGARPAGGAGGAKAAAGSSPSTQSSGSSSSTSSSSISSSSAKIYDVRDTNKDGVVSYAEELAYELKHATQDDQNSSSATYSQRQAGLNAYQQGQTIDSDADSSRSLSV